MLSSRVVVNLRDESVRVKTQNDVNGEQFVERLKSI